MSHEQSLLFPPCLTSSALSTSTSNPTPSLFLSPGDDHCDDPQYVATCGPLAEPQIPTGYEHRLESYQVQSDYAKTSGPRRDYLEGRICVRRYDHIVPIRQGASYKDREGNWKQAWPNCINLNGAKTCAPQATGDLHDERSEDVRATRMQDAVKDRDVLTLPRKSVREVVEEIPKGIRRR